MAEHEFELNEHGQARRRFLKQAATVAWASPLIVTMMSRTAHAQPGAFCGAITGLGGCDNSPPCGTGFQCIPGPVELGECICQGIPGGG